MSWFTDFANQAMKLVDDLADSVVSQATEAQQQIMQEQKKLQLEEAQKQRIFQAFHSLPWETDIESRQMLCNDLMETILQVSLKEKNFSVRAANADEVEFDFQEFVPVAMQLLELDSNLARFHAKLSPKMNEEDFWFNYYCRVIYLRARSGIDGSEALHNSANWNLTDILMGYEPPSPVIYYYPLESTPTADSSGIQSSPVAPISGNRNNPDFSPQFRNDAAANQEDDDDDIDLDDLDDELIDIKDHELLEELGDLSHEDFEQIGSSEANDALEAQIAQELAEEA
jgi:hypothetical protein